MRKNFRTYQLAIELYGVTLNLKLPKHLRDQFNRAAASIVLNIAEGCGRATAADQKRFYDIALGSLRECQAVLDLTSSAGSPEALLADKLGAHLYKLIRYVRARP